MRATLIALVASVAACYSPNIPDGTYQCTDPANTCPQGMVCNSCKLCVHAGKPLDAGTCLSCGGVVQCTIDHKCQFNDTACVNACIPLGTPTGQQLGHAVLDCMYQVCSARCAITILPDCSTCLYNFDKGTNSAAGPCNPSNDSACNQCVTDYNACTADRSGN